MNDNTSSHMSTEYDDKVRMTIPNYDFFIPKLSVS
jgi:hypothetical protein